MTTEEFSPEEEAVFNAIVDQRRSLPHLQRDFFIYDANEGLAYLNATDDAAKFGLDVPKQLEIIHGLAKYGIIDADWVIDVDEFEEGFEGLGNIGYTLARDLDWVRKELDDELRCFRKQQIGYSCVIHLSFDDIKTINEKFITKYSATLSCNKEGQFFVECAGEKIIIKKLRCCSTPYQVLAYAFDNAGEIITRDRLKEQGLIKKAKLSLATYYYAKESPVRTVLYPFVQLLANGICVHKTAVITQRQLNELRASES